MDPERKSGDVFGTPLLNTESGKASPSPATTLAQEQESRQHNHRTASGKYRSYLLRSLYGPLKFIIIFGVVAVLLSVPCIVIGGETISSKADIGAEAFMAQQTRQIIYYIFGWLLLSWIGLAISYAFGTVLPYIFRFIAR
jgi:hypothetical protein